VRAPDWLTARPVAHRGLHDAARGIIENMPAAAQAAVDGNFGIECDVQLTSDGEAMVHHDDELGHGIIAEREYTAADWPEANAAQRRGMLHLRHAFRTRPDFVAYWVNDLPAAAPWIARHLFGLPLLTWTVRTQEQRERAARYADQMIFEGFRPGT
jgi:glycerophosphoryl diester phosphodiesterase